MQTTHCLLEGIKTKFETIRIITGERLHLEELEHPKYLQALLTATESAYILLNDGLCESLHMCQLCAQRRDQLLEYMHFFDDFARGIRPKDAHAIVEQFPALLDTMIANVSRVIASL